MAEFGLGTGPAQRVLNQLCDEGVAVKLDYGRDVAANHMSKPLPAAARGDNGYAERGARIREARMALGLLVKDLAAISGLHPSVVSMAERGSINKSGGPTCGRPAYSKLETALGLNDEETQSG